MRADNSRHLTTAARQRAEQTRARAVRALRRLDETGKSITFEAVAAEAGVSRSWLYSQQDIRSEIQALRTRRQPSPAAPLTPQRQRATEASLLRRLEATSQRMRHLEEDNRQLRQALAEALGSARTAQTLSLIHISEPTRLLSISYAVFCLKKKKNKPQNHPKHHQPKQKKKTTKKNTHKN